MLYTINAVLSYAMLNAVVGSLMGSMLQQVSTLLFFTLQFFTLLFWFVKHEACQMMYLWIYLEDTRYVP